MSAIHFDITGDNSNIINVVNDTTRKMEELASTAKDLSASFDMDTPAHSIQALEKAITENEKVIGDYKKQLEDLAEKQREAALAGDTEKVKQYGDEMATLAQRCQEVAVETETMKNALGSAGQEMDNNSGIMVKLLGGQEKYNTIISELPPRLRNAITGLNGMTKAAKAFIATPLGAILAALILAYKALTSWLGKTSEGQRKLAEITGYFSGVMQGLLQVAKKAGESLYKAFTDPVGAVKKLGNGIKDFVIGRFRAVIGASQKLVEALGQLNRMEFKEAGQSFKDAFKTLVEGSVADKIGDTIKGINDIGKAESDLNVKRDQLRRDRMDWMKEEGELDKQIAEQRNKLYVGSMAERQKASATMMDLINKKYDKQIEFAQREYEIKRDSNALTDSSLEDLEEEASLEKQVLELEAQRETAKRMAVRVDNMAARSGLATAEKSREMEERREQLMESLSDATAEAERQANAVRISAMKEGFEKEKAEIDHEHEVRVAQIRENYQKQIREIEKIQKAEWKASHGGSTAGFAFNADDEAAKKALAVSTAELNNENKRYEVATEQHLENLVKQYQTFAEKEKEIIRRGNEDIAQLEKEGYTEQAKERAKAMEKELTELRSHEKDIYKRLAKDTSKWGIVSIQKAIEDAQTELDDLSSTPEKAVANAQAIDNLKRAIEGLKQTAKDFSLTGVLKMLLTEDKGAEGTQTLAERIDAMRRAWADMSTEDKWKNIGGWSAKIASSLGKAAAHMRKVAELTGNDALSDSAERLGAVAQNFEAAGQGAAQGGWIGAIVGGALDILSQTVEAFQNVNLQEAIATKNAQDWAYALETAFLNIDTDKFDSVFGEKAIGLAQENYRKAIQALDTYGKKMQELNEKYLDGIFGPMGGGIEMLKQMGLYEELMKRNFSGLQFMKITTKQQTGWAKFWGANDEETTLGELAPELWDENGDLIIANAQKFLSVNTQISAEQRKEIEQLIELKQGYDDALKAVDDAISDTFGGLASDLTDVIWDSVMSGADAWERFGEIGADAIAKLGKQMIQEMLISEYLEQYRGKMRAAYGLGNASDTQNALRDITAEIFSGMEGMLAAGSLVAEEYKQWAAEHGFDLTNVGSVKSQEAKAGGFETMSQDTASELNGRFTALQLSNELIAQAAREGLAQIIAMGGMLAAGNGTLAEIRNFHMLEVGYLEDIAKQTKPILEFGAKLDKISDNTSRL